MTPTPSNAPPGTEIVCVQAKGKILVVGRIYTVESWCIHPHANGVNLVGEKSAQNMGFYPNRFRLLHPASQPEFYTQVRTQVREPVDA